ncbi:hypothetical protein CASFOL_001171 [Castilleja foliolosa]|uniref:NB-ARC domain-containing protein n=1 Tax=Castilleja foliolosa TaxID=1961234 RepID=A0ABD3EMC0_9LAMI
MAAYAAIVSLLQFLHPDQFPVLYRTPEIESLYTKARSLQSSLEKIFPVHKIIRDTVNELDVQIRDEIYKAQDIIESFIFKQNPTSPTFQHDLIEVIEKLDPVEVQTKAIADSIEDDSETNNASSDDAALSSASVGIGQLSTRIVGQKEDFDKITRKLNEDNSKLQILSIMGLPGIGKTTLARSIYEDPGVQSVFTTRAWVTVSQESQVTEIFTKLLSSIDSKDQKAGDTVVQPGTSLDQLTLELHQKLFKAKYLVVIDDMWYEDVWDRVKTYLPDEKNGSRIILTTRLATIVKHANKDGFQIEVQPLNEEDRWILLREKAFGGGSGLDYLEKTGRLIANNCGGIPLLLTVIGGLLFREKKTEDYWENIRDDTYSAAAKGEESYSEILSLSYNHLPGMLKGCFLYMGAFPEDSEILVKKIIKLWVAEGFLKPIPDRNIEQQATASSLPLGSPEQVAKKFLEDLIMRNLLATRKWTSNGHTKAFGIHDSLRDLAMKKCQKEKFFHAINKYVEKNDLPDGACEQRRLSVHKNILVCMEKVYDSAMSISSARTLLYAGPHHHHPLPFKLTFNLLRVLDALTVYFIEFPNEIIDLIYLRFLSLTYNGKLPASISKLQKLQTLIVHRNPKIIFIGSSYFPVEIWSMPELRHLLFMESELPHPSECAIIPTNKSVLFQHLQTLSNVNAASCTREVLRNTPNLRKLGMWVEKPGPVGFYLDELQHLEAFKFTVLNPSPRVNVDFLPKLHFPKMLKKLSLSGCGIPWEDMTVIGQLEFLEVLKLRELAFKGGEWEPNEGEFLALKYLLLEYVDLKYWGAGNTHFPSLESLTIRHCYELEAMDPEIRMIGGLKLIEMVDCSPLAVEWAKYVQDENKNKKLRVRIYTSWE